MLLEAIDGGPARRGRACTPSCPRTRSCAARPRAPAWRCATCAPRRRTSTVPQGPTAGRTSVRVVHSVGSDTVIGKKVVTLELDRAARERGRRSVFVPTGQTGVAIAGWGIAVDHVISDYVAGAAERLVHEGAERGDLLFVEGQGALFHPGLLRRHARPAARLARPTCWCWSTRPAPPRSATTRTCRSRRCRELIAAYEAVAAARAPGAGGGDRAQHGRPRLRRGGARGDRGGRGRDRPRGRRRGALRPRARARRGAARRCDPASSASARGGSPGATATAGVADALARRLPARGHGRHVRQRGGRRARAAGRRAVGGLARPRRCGRTTSSRAGCARRSSGRCGRSAPTTSTCS